MFTSTKTYGHDRGFSCCFRQWRATHSHCHFLHGYALSFKFTFGAKALDDKNWVQDFGALNELENLLRETFDHKLVVAQDDPQLDLLSSLAGVDVADVLVVPQVSIEIFAAYAFQLAVPLVEGPSGGRVVVLGCQVAEHPGNSAGFYREND